MAKDLDVSVSLINLDKTIKALSGKQIGVAKNALKKGAVAIVGNARQELRSAIKKRTGNLSRAVKSRSTRGGGAILYVDRSGGTSGKGYHIHIVDKGTKKRATAKGRNRGTMPAANIVEPVRRRANALVVNELAPRITKAILDSISGDLS
jgi:hypothetical protein